MGAEHHMLDLEVRDGELECRRGVDVRGRDDGGEVAVRIDVSWLAAEDGGFRDAGVGAANPDFSVLVGGNVC